MCSFKVTGEVGCEEIQCGHAFIRHGEAGDIPWSCSAGDWLGTRCGRRDLLHTAASGIVHCSECYGCVAVIPAAGVRLGRDGNRRAWRNDILIAELLQRYGRAYRIFRRRLKVQELGGFTRHSGFIVMNH